MDVCFPPPPPPPPIPSVPRPVCVPQVKTELYIGGYILHQHPRESGPCCNITDAKMGRLRWEGEGEELATYTSVARLASHGAWTVS